MRLCVRCAAVLICWSLLGCVADQTEEPPPFQRYRIEQFVETVSIRGGSFSPDETELLYSSKRAGTWIAFTVPIQGGRARPITDSIQASVYAHSFFPRDRRFLFSSQVPAGRFEHIYLRLLEGKVKDLTPDPEASFEFQGWSRDRKSFFYVRRQQGESRDLFEMDAESFESRLLFRNEQEFRLGPVSDDRRFVALSQMQSVYDSDLYLYDRKAALLQHLSPHDGPIFFVPVTFEVGTHNLYYLSDEGSEFNYLMRYDAQTGRRGKVEEADGDIVYAQFSRTGQYRVVGINNDGSTDLRVYEAASGEQVALPDLPAGQITSVRFSSSESYMAFNLDGPRSPNDLFVYEFASRSYRKLTESLSPEIDPRHLVDPEVVRYPSFDELEIPAVYYRPQQIAEDEQVPGLIWANDGGYDASQIRFRPLVQYLVNHGYAVLAVNNRGSRGYGKTFLSLNHRRHGRDDLQDCIAGKRFLASTGEVDPERIAIIGGSYGGFLVLAGLAFQPKEFAAGIDLYGVNNWIYTLQSIPPWSSARKVLFQKFGHPEQDAEYLQGISPLYHADSIKRPLLVVQGGRDPRVSRQDTDRLVEIIRGNGVPVDYKVFEDEEHLVRSKENKIRLFKTILKFLEVHLKE